MLLSVPEYLTHTFTSIQKAGTQQEVRNKWYGVKCGSLNAYARDSTDKGEESSIPKSTVS